MMMSPESKDEGEIDDRSCNKAGPFLITDETLLWNLGPGRDYVKPAEQFWTSRIRAFINIKKK